MKYYFEKSWVLLLLVMSIQGRCQDLRKVVTYYDPITKTRIHESYTTLNTPPYPMHGVYEKYDAYGALMSRGTYSQGKKNGTFTNYFSTEMTGLYGKAALGKIWSATTYANDKENGLDKLYSVKNGQQVLIKQITWVTGTKVKEEEWNEEGKPTKLIQPNGSCFEYYSNGNKKVEYVAKNGKLEGKYTAWYPSGQIQVAATFLNDVENGKRVEYFENGKPELEANYVNGKMSGLVMLYFDSGKSRKAINYDPNTFSLVDEKEYSRNEVLKFERKVVSGNQCKSITYDSLKGFKIQELEELYDHSSNTYLKNGKAFRYHANGKTSAEATFDRGQLNGLYKELDESGEPVKSGEYKNGEPTGNWLYYFDAEWNPVSNKGKASYYRKIDYTSVKGPWPTTDYFITGEKQFQGMLARVDPDVPAGKCIYYYQTGMVSQEVELDNAGNFKSQKVYFENGKLDKEAVAVNTQYGPGQEWIEYYPDGRVKAKGKTAEVGKVGVWTYFDENGNSRQVVER